MHPVNIAQQIRVWLIWDTEYFDGSLWLLVACQLKAGYHQETSNRPLMEQTRTMARKQPFKDNYENPDI